MIQGMTKLFLALLAGLVLGFCLGLMLPHPLGVADVSFRAVASSINALVDTIAETDATFRDRYATRLKGSNP